MPLRRRDAPVGGSPRQQGAAAGDCLNPTSTHGGSEHPMVTACNFFWVPLDWLGINWYSAAVVEQNASVRVLGEMTGTAQDIQVPCGFESPPGSRRYIVFTHVGGMFTWQLAL